MVGGRQMVSQVALLQPHLYDLNKKDNNEDIVYVTCCNAQKGAVECQRLKKRVNIGQYESRGTIGAGPRLGPGVVTTVLLSLRPVEIS
eukprot:562491-Pyramimonas_sp.AAC.1